MAEQHSTGTSCVSEPSADAPASYVLPYLELDATNPLTSSGNVQDSIRSIFSFTRFLEHAAEAPVYGSTPDGTDAEGMRLALGILADAIGNVKEALELREGLTND